MLTFSFFWVGKHIILKIDSLSNHDDDGNNTAQICIFDNEKQYFCTLCACIYLVLTFCRRSCSFFDVKWPVLQVCGRCEHMMTNFVFSCPKRWFQLNSRIVRTPFSSIMSLNNWKMIAETRSHIFWWRSCFRRRHVCLSSLIGKFWPPQPPSGQTFPW